MEPRRCHCCQHGACQLPQNQPDQTDALRQEASTTATPAAAPAAAPAPAAAVSWDCPSHRRHPPAQSPPPNSSQRPQPTHATAAATPGTAAAQPQSTSPTNRYRCCCCSPPLPPCRGQALPPPPGPLLRMGCQTCQQGSSPPAATPAATGAAANPDAAPAPAMGRWQGSRSAAATSSAADKRCQRHQGSSLGEHTPVARCRAVRDLPAGLFPPPPDRHPKLLPPALRLYSPGLPLPLLPVLAGPAATGCWRGLRSAAATSSAAATGRRQPPAAAWGPWVAWSSVTFFSARGAGVGG